MTLPMVPVLSVAEMRAAEAPHKGVDLMETAGWQVARVIRQKFSCRPVLILCGPGNNGGDGYGAARWLRRWGWPVTVVALQPDGAAFGDAALMAARWQGGVSAWSPSLLNKRPLVVDALYGSGLTRPLDGLARQMLEAVAASGVTVVAVDVPSGVQADRGEALGIAAQAAVTVTFEALKPGHLLLPGRTLCGEIIVTRIGLKSLSAGVSQNLPSLWLDHLPRPSARDHKYQRGHLLLAGGAELTGAARLAVLAGRRIGAGLATVAVPHGLELTYGQDHPGTMVRPLTAWPDLLADPRINAAVIGPGFGVGELARRLTLQSLSAGKACVLDADALTSFAGNPALLWSARGSPVLTPHDGEFARLFTMTGDRLTRARTAARESGSVVVLKGADCVVAAPDGRAAIAANAPPTLATSGAGDVLAGMIGGLLAQGMDRFMAACAAVWLHGEAARRFGAGLVAEDLIDCLPSVLEALWFDNGR